MSIIVAVGVIFAIGSRMPPSDCTSLEQYDVLSGSCYYECSTGQDCAGKASKVDAALNTYFDGAKSQISTKSNQQSPVAPTTSSVSSTKQLTREFTGSETNGKIYTVNANLLLLPKPSDHDEKLWNLFKRIAGNDDIRKYIQSFEVFNDTKNDSAASVWTSQTPGKWHVNVNAAYDSDSKDLIHTMVHEYGHIVSLNNTQVPAIEGVCPRLTLPEGCANQAAYIQAFYTKFWDKYGYDKPQDMGSNTEAVTAFYEDHRDSFVSDYAATNYGEDWAESWAAFVTGSKPVANTEKAKKVQFFYDYPGLVAARNRIRLEIASSKQSLN